MEMLRLTLKNGLRVEQQETVVRELKEDIAELRLQIGNKMVQKSMSELNHWSNSSPRYTNQIEPI